jgi:glycogen debranching enzyme
MRYGFVDVALRVVGGLMDASAASGGRLPELFAGFSRSEVGAPVAYPTSCTPQAWASAAALEIVRLLLRLDPAAPHGHVGIAPVLPAGVSRLRVEGIDIAGQKLTVDVDGDRCEISGAGPLTIHTGSSPR